MGGQPKTAISIVGFPAKGRDFTILAPIMAGGLDKLNEAEVALLGGHSVRDDDIGTGLVTTAAKQGKALPEHVQAAVRAMLQLNRRASEIVVELEVHSMTDITGFGLVGHAIEVAKASRITISTTASYPFTGNARIQLSRFLCRRTDEQSAIFPKDVLISDTVSVEEQNVLYDPHTSGG
jgi:selenide,water dikinase